MKVNEFGEANKKKIILIPGTLMCWKQFSEIIPFLEKDYHVMAVSTDGFDGEKNSTFTTAKNRLISLRSILRKRKLTRSSLYLENPLGLLRRRYCITIRK